MHVRLCPFAVAVVVAALAPTVSSVHGDETEAQRYSVAFVVWDGVELIELMGPAAIFSSAAGLDEFTVGEAIEPLSSRFLTIVPDYTFDDCPRPDVIVIPGGRGGLSPASEQRIASWVRDVEPGARAIMAVCNGVVILANSGLLDGREATGPLGHLDEAIIIGRDITPVVPARYHQSGKFVTTQSYFAAVDAALHVVKLLRGEAEARRVAEWNNHPWQEIGESDSSVAPRAPFATGRLLVYQTLMKDGVDAAVQRFRNLAAGVEIAPGPQSGMSVPNQHHFVWLSGSLANAGRSAEAEKLARFMLAAFPDSVRPRVCLAEALASGGQAAQALEQLLAAAGSGIEVSRVRVAIANVLHRPDCAPGDQTRRAREFLNAHPFEFHAGLTAEDEPGTPLVVTGTVSDQDGNPLQGARLHVFQADAQGRYTPQKVMDEPNARLFAYLRTDDRGRYEFETIRPGGYPVPDGREGIEWQIPAHIHFEVSADGHDSRRFQLVFDDDPRMRPDYWRDWAARDGHPIADAQPNPRGPSRAACDIVLRAAKE